MLEKIRSVQFVMIVSFVSSLLLAFVAMSLKPSIEKNIILDKKQSILKSIDIDVSNLSNIELDEKYDLHIEEMVIDKDGNLINDIKLSDIVWIENKGNGSTNYVFELDGNTYINEFFVQSLSKFFYSLKLQIFYLTPLLFRSDKFLKVF